MRQFFSVNGDLFVRSLCLMGVYLAFSAISARFGDTYLAMCSIMMKLMLIFSYFTDGFAFAGEALTGRFIGANDPGNLRETVKWTFIWSMGIGMLFVFLYAAAGDLRSARGFVCSACRTVCSAGSAAHPQTAERIRTMLYLLVEANPQEIRLQDFAPLIADAEQSGDADFAEFLRQAQEQAADARLDPEE